MKKLAVIFVFVYLLCGVFFAGLMKTHIPALNVAGMAYIAVSWPFHLRVMPSYLRAPIPSWVFTFRQP